MVNLFVDTMTILKEIPDSEISMSKQNYSQPSQVS